MSSLPPPPQPPTGPTGPGAYTEALAPPAPRRPADHAGRLQWILGLAATLGLVAALSAAWPADDGPATVDDETSTTLMSAEIAAQLGAPDVGGFPTPEQPAVTPTELFVVGPDAAVGEVLAAAGIERDNGAVRPVDQLRQLTIYPTYLFVAYVPPADEDRIERAMWRDGTVDEPDGNPIDDTVDASTEPKLFSLDELDLALRLVPSMVQDAVTRYDIPVEVTHIIIDRFLPFDERVLVRVYASPPGDPMKGGYVTYTTAGVFQKVCC